MGTSKAQTPGKGAGARAWAVRRPVRHPRVGRCPSPTPGSTPPYAREARRSAWLHRRCVPLPGTWTEAGAHQVCTENIKGAKLLSDNAAGGSEPDSEDGAARWAASSASGLRLGAQLPPVPASPPARPGWRSLSPRAGGSLRSGKRLRKVRLPSPASQGPPPPPRHDQSRTTTPSTPRGPPLGLARCLQRGSPNYNSRHAVVSAFGPGQRHRRSVKSSALPPKFPVALAREGRGGVGRCPRQASWTDPGRGPLTRGFRVAGIQEPGGGPGARGGPAEPHGDHARAGREAQ